MAEAAGERVFAELRRLVIARRACSPGWSSPTGSGCSRAVLPELTALHGVEQSPYHHLDVYDHTLEVLARQVELESALESASAPTPSACGRCSTSRWPTS